MPRRGAGEKVDCGIVQAASESKSPRQQVFGRTPDRRSGRVIGLCATALAATACAKASPEPQPKYPLETCARIFLEDAETHAPVIGAEDFAVDAGRDRLIVSAFDREAVRAAVAARAPEIPEGGLYSVPFAALFEAKSMAKAAPLARGFDFVGGLRPHGIVYVPYKDEIAFVNVGYEMVGRGWREKVRIERVGADGEAVLGAEGETHCAANDLADDGAGAIVSFDHRSCGFGAFIENTLTLRRSGVVRETGEALFDRAAFANGVLALESGEIVLAATREKAAILLRKDGALLVEKSRVRLPGGPDNLTQGEGATIIAAVHPRLMVLGAHSRLGIGQAPSRIVAFSTDADAVERLFEDPTGEVFSGATVAVERDGALVVGSPTEAGVLLCRVRE
jgi:hypothetical protein